MERSGMLSPTCSATVRLQRTKLRNEFELAHRSPQLNKHGVVPSFYFIHFSLIETSEFSCFEYLLHRLILHYQSQCRDIVYSDY